MGMEGCLHGSGIGQHSGLYNHHFVNRSGAQSCSVSTRAEEMVLLAQAAQRPQGLKVRWCV